MVGEQIIAHADLDCFYASVEMNERPELRGKRMAVCGSTENRHGIVLAKSYEAKAYGVKTGQANWEAMRACPGLICVESHYDIYLKYSRLVRSIYARYTDTIEPFGMDECWLAFNGCGNVERDGAEIADEIRRAVRSETGLTVSIGVSFTKIFAKLGSDMRKPDGVTVLGRSGYQGRIWPLPVSELLYVGRATARRLQGLNILTIGDLAHSDAQVVRNCLGKNGVMLWLFANGMDGSRVMPGDYVVPIKSVGHGTTCVVDLDTDYQVWLVLLELAQDVGRRLMANSLSATGVQITVKDEDLACRQYQMPLPYPTQSPMEIAEVGYALFRARYSWKRAVRALTIRGISLVSDKMPVQLDMFNDYAKRERRMALDKTVNEIRGRFGYRSIYSAALMGDLKMAADRCETVTMPSLMYQ